MPKSCKKVARNFLESCQKNASKLQESCQKVAENLPESCQKVMTHEKVMRKSWDSHDEKVMRRSWDSHVTTTRQCTTCRHVCSCQSPFNRVATWPWLAFQAKAMVKIRWLRYLGSENIFSIYIYICLNCLLDELFTNNENKNIWTF